MEQIFVQMFILMGDFVGYAAVLSDLAQYDTVVAGILRYSTAGIVPPLCHPPPHPHDFSVSSSCN